MFSENIWTACHFREGLEYELFLILIHIGRTACITVIGQSLWVEDEWLRQEVIHGEGKGKEGARYAENPEYQEWNLIIEAALE